MEVSATGKARQSWRDNRNLNAPGDTGAREWGTVLPRSGVHPPVNPDRRQAYPQTITCFDFTDFTEFSKV